MVADSRLQSARFPTEDHLLFLQTLTAEDRKQLTSRTNRHALVRLGSMVVLQLFLSVVIFNGWFMWPLAVVVMGLLLMCLFHLMHECIHATAFESRAVNRVVAWVCGLLLLLPPSWFRHFHFTHHRYTQDPARDPELARPKPLTRLQWICHVSGAAIWLASFQLLLRGMLGRVDDDFIPLPSRASVCREIRVMLVVYALVLVVSLISGSTLVIWLWWIPGLIGQPFLRLYLLAEHADCESSDNMFLNTRTVLTHPLIRWFTWNMPYHTEHHVYPAVPFHRLPDMHHRIRQDIRHLSSGYVEFNQRYASRLESQ